jgi:hypothetical protein
MISLQVSFNMSKSIKLSININGEKLMRLCIILVNGGITWFGGALYQC